MSKENVNKEEIVQTFEKLINQAAERGKTDAEYGVGIRLFLTEIHAVALIGDRPGICQQELCELLGVTKGRISALIANLERKELVTRRPEPARKNVPLYLTGKGKQAYEYHKQKEKKMLHEITQQLDELTQDETDKFMKLVEAVTEILKG